MMAVREKEILLLISSLKTRDKGYEMLISDYQKPLYFFIRRMLLNHEDTNDVLQDTFVRVFKGVDRFRGESALGTWMHSIAYREALGHIQRSKRMLKGDWDGNILENVKQLEEDAQYSGDEMQLKLQAMVAALPEKQRAVFVMKYYEEKKYTEIAEITGTSVGALKASYHHAVEKIKSAIQSNDWINEQIKNGNEE
jgi:RNA polymerase sigma-70 factor (ECF subfamily)